MPFAKLIEFFLKAVLAGIPAQFLLTTLLWLVGQGLQTFFPQLLKLTVLSYLPQQRLRPRRLTNRLRLPAAPTANDFFRPRRSHVKLGRDLMPAALYPGS